MCFIDSKCVAFCRSSQTVLQPSRSRFSAVALPSNPWGFLRAPLGPRVLLTTPDGQYMGANSVCELVLVICHRTVPLKSMLLTRGAAVLGYLCKRKSPRWNVSTFPGWCLWLVAAGLLHQLLKVGVHRVCTCSVVLQGSKKLTHDPLIWWVIAVDSRFWFCAS